MGAAYTLVVVATSTRWMSYLVVKACINTLHESNNCHLNTGAAIAVTGCLGGKKRVYGNG